MALDATDRGTGSNTTASTTVQISPASDYNTGSMAILALAYDNSGGGGADPFSSITDNVGNTWTSRQNSLRDPGAASAGCVLRIFTCNPTSALLASTIITVTFTVNTTAKSWTLSEVIPAAGSNAEYVTGNVANGASTTPTINTTSITNGNLVFGATSIENTSVITAEDSDTTNGSWVTQQTINAGTGTTGIQVSSQYKIVTATGTQTYNLTISTSSDWANGWIEIKETAVDTLYDPMGMFGFFGI